MATQRPIFITGTGAARKFKRIPLTDTLPLENIPQIDLAKLPNIPSGKMLARTTAGTGAVELIDIPAGGSGGGDASTNTALSVDNELALFSGTTGKLIKRATATGIAILTAGVLSAVATLETTQITDDAVTYAKLQNISATSRILGRKTAGAGNAEELTLSELLDFIGSAAHGDILYRGSGSWSRLAPGTSGQFLQTQGAGANPQWATASGGGGGSYDESNPIYDSTSNELMKFIRVASATNEWSVSNNSTGNNPIWATSGGDANITGTVAPKGTGGINLLTSNGSDGLIFDSVNYGSAYRFKMYSNFGDMNFFYAGGQAVNFTGSSYHDVKTAAPYCRFTIGAAFKLLAASPAQITANQNNYLSGTAYTSESPSVFRLDASTPVDVTGMYHGGANWQGQFMIWINVSANTITLKHDDASSTAGYRFLNTTGADIPLAQNKIAFAWYDNTSQRWRVMPQF